MPRRYQRGSVGPHRFPRGGSGQHEPVGTQCATIHPMTDRTRIRRLPEKALDDVAALHAVLDAARVAHVAFLHDGSPVNIPVAAARDGDRLLLHGSTGSRLFRTLADGAEVCA